MFVPSSGPVLPSAPNGLGVGGQIVWRPGSPSDLDHVETWGEVYAAIQATSGRVVVLVDNSLALPVIPVGVYQLELRVEFAALTPYFGLSGPPTIVSMSDGAVLANLLGIQQNVRLQTNQTTAPALTYDDFANAILSNGGVLENLGTRPVIDVAAGRTFGLGLKDTGVLSGSTPLIHLVGTAAMALNVTDSSFIQNDIISGDAASTLIYIGDDTFVPPTLAGFLGTYGIDYRASNAARNTPAAGPTLGRPTGGIPFGPLVGQMYFDTDIVKPVWWDGAQWVDATGAPA